MAEHVFEDDGRRLGVTVDGAAVERECGEREEVARLAHQLLLVHVTVGAVERKQHSTRDMGTATKMSCSTEVRRCSCIPLSDDPP